MFCRRLYVQLYPRIVSYLGVGLDSVKLIAANDLPLLEATIQKMITNIA